MSEIDRTFQPVPLRLRGQKPPDYVRVVQALKDEELEEEILGGLGEPGYRAALVAELDRRAKRGAPS